MTDYRIDKDTINRKLTRQLVDARVARIFNSFGKVLVTSSFGVTSAVLLHVVSRVKPGYPIYFIDTGYHFQETLAYKERLSRMLNLNVKVLKPDPSRHQITKMKKMWSSNPDRCCDINKVEPLRRTKSLYEIWMSGMIGFEDTHRERLDIIVDKSGMLRCYPLIDWNKSGVDEYMELYGLPKHPLAEKGFGSVGCTHCTEPGTGRKGRWSGSEKKECGLHYDD